MNKATQKSIKEISKYLPRTYQKVILKRRTKGSELIKDGVKTDAQGNDINPDHFYFSSFQVLKPLNAYRGLKKAYNKGKEEGVGQYIQWLDRHAKYMNDYLRKIKREDMVTEINEEISEIAKGDPKGILKKLLQFLMSFLMAFGKKKENEPS